MDDVIWRSFKIAEADIGWEAASYNVNWEDGKEYGRWRRVLRRHSHGLTVISRYAAPPGKAWKIVGKASRLGEEVYILEGAYYNGAGRVIAGPGTFMFNAPGAIHGGISRELTLFIHCCSGEPDELLSVELIDFEPVGSPSWRSTDTLPDGSSPATCARPGCCRSPGPVRAGGSCGR